MKKVWMLLAGVAAGFLASCAGPVAVGPVREVGVAEAQRLVATGQAVPIDTRSPHEFSTGHIPGAVLVPFGSNRVDRQVSKAAGGKQAVIYCRIGKRSALMLPEMAEVPGILHLTGGFTAWKAAGGPIEKGIEGPMGAESGLERRLGQEHRTEVYDFF